MAMSAEQQISEKEEVGSDPAVLAGSSAATEAKAASSSASSSSLSSSQAQTKSSVNQVESQLQEAQRLKDEGNDFFKQGKRYEAMTKWHHALLNASGINSLASHYGLPSDEEQNQRAKSLVVAVQNNLASCYLAEKKYDKILYATGKVLSIDEKNVKAYFRRAKAYLALGENQKAANDVDKAMELAPEDPAVRALAQELVDLEEAKLAKQKKEMGGFLKKDKSKNDQKRADAEGARIGGEQR